MNQLFLLFSCADQDVTVYISPGESLVVAEVRAIIPIQAADGEQVLNIQKAHKRDSLLGHCVL